MSMKKYVIFVGYVVVSLLIGKDIHPFSRYPMYDSFPNYSYSFYVADDDNQPVYFMNNFKTQANEIGHMYSEICEEHNFNHGMGLETDSQLTVVGGELLDYIIRAREKKLVTDSLSIHRVYYLFENDKIIRHDKQLCKRKVE